ncbi:MAG: glycoside hydrolase family 108 protein [Aeromonadaceae bacterium]
MFDTVFDRTIGSEGGFQADRRDRGNWTGGEVGKGELKGTKYGLSAMTYPDLDIKAITLKQAKDIYRRDWWDKLGMERWPKSMQFQMFDAAFNHGSGRANQFLQYAVGVKQDGKIGPATMAAINAMDANDIVMRFLAKRLRYFTEAKTWDAYSRGWTRRVADCLEFAAEDN